MGSYDGAEVCELVGLYLLNEINQEFPEGAMGLYRDDGLGALSSSGPEGDRQRKQIERIFIRNGLKVKADSLTPKANHLDVTFDLTSGRYWPYRKPNSETLYVNTLSNHPPNVIKQIPDSIGRRISSLSCDQETFNNAKPHYEEALKRSGYKSTLNYTPPPPPPDPETEVNQNETRKRRRRKRQIIWFNPPFDKQVATNVAQRFLSLIDKHFSEDRDLKKLFNRNNVKVSYSCMPNMASIIKSHNSRILTPPPPTRAKACSCQRPGPNFENCPLKGVCMTESVIYRATVTAPNTPVKHYVGLAGNTFKERWYKHNDSMKAPKPETGHTGLSDYIWKLREQGKEGKISWEIVQKCVPYQCGSRRCDVCLSEKLHILLADQPTSLNKRSELVGACRHQQRYRHSNRALKMDAT